jgi:hypothetical protein
MCVSDLTKYPKYFSEIILICAVMSSIEEPGKNIQGQIERRIQKN